MVRPSAEAQVRYRARRALKAKKPFNARGEVDKRIVEDIRAEVENGKAGAGAVSADGAGSCSGEVSDRLQAAAPGRKRLRSGTRANRSSRSSATTDEQSAKCQKGEGQ